MNTDLAGRLRRLGLGKGPAALRPVEQRRQARSVENLLPGRLLPCENSACFVTERNYPLDWSHGTQSLGSLLDASTKAAGTMFREPSLAQLSFRDFVFLDTETTGLSGGTGTIAFLVGVGFFEGSQFVVRQFFLRSPDDEPAMLAGLTEQLVSHPGIVSFNGRSFDIPLLETRYILNRRPPPFSDSPHLDLLQPARRLWRDSLDSCRLLALEEQVLGIRRDQTDIPGGLIPGIYRDYLRTGNGIEMPRIFYHNRVDVLSMVTLISQLCRIFERPNAELDTGQHWLSLARWYEALGLTAGAEEAYRCAIETGLTTAAFQDALSRLGRLLKRSGRRDDAQVIWRQLAAVEMDDVRGHTELAKQCEWHTRDLEEAVDWTRAALRVVEHWPRGIQSAARPELTHRLARLERKISKSAARK